MPVENQGAQGFSVHILGYDHQRFAVLVGDFQSRYDALDAGDLLLTEQQVGVLELTLLTWKQNKTDGERSKYDQTLTLDGVGQTSDVTFSGVDEVRRDVTTVKLHSLNDLQLVLQSLPILLQTNILT